MTPSQSVPPFSDPDWVYELDFEGLRAFIGKHFGEPIFRVRQQIDTAPLLAVLRHELGRLGCETVILDAVLVALDDAGRPSRDKLSEAWNSKPESIAVYLVDILHWEGFSTRNLNLLDRKALLRSILPASDTLLFTNPVVERGENLALEASRAGIKALIAKRSDSPYNQGPSDQWKRIVVPGAEEQTLPRNGGTVGSSPRVKLSNPTKVFWPEQGYTKKDLYGYYDAVAEYLLPHLRRRPVHLHRYPNGINGKDFFQRQAPEHTPAWVQRVEFREKDERYILCDDRRTLLYLVNLGSIDLHPWLSRAESPDTPDWAVVDIDAKDSSFADAAKIARKTGSLLRGVGIRSFVKTSGATGLHVFVPLRASYSYEQSRMFAEAVARVVVMENKRTATVERNPQKRDGKVYLDFLQNRRGQTIVPPYCVRPVPGARVSMPLDWDELRGDLNPGRFTLMNASKRIREAGDRFRPVLEMDQDLLPAIEALAGYLRGEGSG